MNSDDARLHGTWCSNRDATVAEVFRSDPKWTNAPPEKQARFRAIFGHMTVTFSNNVVTTHYQDNVDSFGYRVVRRGSDYLVIHYDRGLSRLPQLGLEVDWGERFFLGF